MPSDKRQRIAQVKTPWDGDFRESVDQACETPGAPKTGQGMIDRSGKNSLHQLTQKSFDVPQKYRSIIFMRLMNKMYFSEQVFLELALMV